jgi:hypothetical protein
MFPVKYIPGEFGPWLGQRCPLPSGFWNIDGDMPIKLGTSDELMIKICKQISMLIFNKLPQGFSSVYGNLVGTQRKTFILLLC